MGSLRSISRRRMRQHIRETCLANSSFSNSSPKMRRLAPVARSGCRNRGTRGVWTMSLANLFAGCAITVKPLLAGSSHGKAFVEYAALQSPPKYTRAAKLKPEIEDAYASESPSRGGQRRPACRIADRMNKFYECCEKMKQTALIFRA